MGRIRDTYTERRRRVVDDLTAVGIDVPRPTDSMNIWVPFPTDAEPVVASMQAKGWMVRPGSVFSASGSRPAAIRVTVAALDDERSAAFAKDLADTVASLAV